MPYDVSRRDALLFSLAGASVAGAGDALSRASPLPGCLRRGFGLPDQAPFREGHAPQQETLKALRRLGMTHVRMPVIAEYVLAPLSGPATISKTLADVDRAIENLLALDFSVSVDLHPGGDFIAIQQRDPAIAHRYLLRGWPQIARRLLRWPTERIFAELLNEPATSDGVWRPFVAELVQSVRAILPRNYIIIGSAPFQRVEALVKWRPLADDKIVYACHYYDPMLFTHQGATWDSSPWGRASRIPFPTAISDPRLHVLARKAEKVGDKELAREILNMASTNWNQEKISGQFSELSRWSEAHNAAVIVNEFGVLKWKAGRTDRLAWIQAVRSAAEAFGFGWAHWDYATAFGLLDDAGKIDIGVLLSLLGAPLPSVRSAEPSARAASPMTTGNDSGTK